MSRRASRRSSSNAQSPISALLGAPGAVAFWDAGHGITKDGSNRVSAWSSRIGSYTVEQAGADAIKPTHTATSPTGRLGIAFAAASSQRLTAPDSVLAALLDGSQPYSALWVAKLASTGATRALWSAGSSSANDSLYEGVTSTGADRRRRFATSATQNDSATVLSTTNLTLGTTVYTGSAYSAWVDGTASLSASANTRAPVCDVFSIGSLVVTGVHSGFWSGELYCLLISTSQWTTDERQRLEAAARAYWGTP